MTGNAAHLLYLQDIDGDENWHVLAAEVARPDRAREIQCALEIVGRVEAGGQEKVTALVGAAFREICKSQAHDPSRVVS